MNKIKRIILVIILALVFYLPALLLFSFLLIFTSTGDITSDLATIMIFIADTAMAILISHYLVKWFLSTKKKLAILLAIGIFLTLLISSMLMFYFWKSITTKDMIPLRGLSESTTRSKDYSEAPEGTMGIVNKKITRTEQGEGAGQEANDDADEIDPLPDAVPVYDNDNTEYILTDPTSEYKHCVLGDCIEASTLTIIKTDKKIIIDFSPQVFEGLYPLLADIDGDSKKEIIATLSGDGQGAQLVVYDSNGNRIASSYALSSGWRQVLAVAEFGPNRELELASIAKPHVRQEVEFFRLEGDKLEKVASIQKYSTHKIGSRNLKLFATLEENNKIFLIVPIPDFKSVAAIARTEAGAEEVWRKEVGKTITSITVENNQLRVNGEILD